MCDTCGFKSLGGEPVRLNGSRLPYYSVGPLAYYNALRELAPELLPDEWNEITKEDYSWLLECVPPYVMNGSAFIVGECMTHAEHGPIHEVVCLVDGKYYKRPFSIYSEIKSRGEFDPEKLRAEIRAKFAN